jgi:hypothetical protein
MWRTVSFTVGWAITDTDETAIAALPTNAWSASLRQDGTATDAGHSFWPCGITSAADLTLDFRAFS